MHESECIFKHKQLWTTFTEKGNIICKYIWCMCSKSASSPKWVQNIRMENTESDREIEFRVIAVLYSQDKNMYRRSIFCTVSTLQFTYHMHFLLYNSWLQCVCVCALNTIQWKMQSIWCGSSNLALLVIEKKGRTFFSLADLVFLFFVFQLCFFFSTVFLFTILVRFDNRTCTVCVCCE